MVKNRSTEVGEKARDIDKPCVATVRNDNRKLASENRDTGVA